MIALKHYFDGTNGCGIEGDVPVSLLISSDSKPNTVGTMYFRYSDGFFDNSACSYNHELAMMSLGMSMSAFTYKGSGDKYIRSLLNTIGCDDRSIKTYKYNVTKASDDSCAYAFAAKTLHNDCHLIPVVIRSHRYGGEWVSNAHVFDESCPDFAMGFKTAADRVYDALSAYIDKYGFDRSRIKFWITGFSRGAAVSNLLGARLTFESGIPKDNIFVYTFAAPLTVYDHAACYTDNIFNILSEMDAVPRVPPAAWGFTRFGTDLYLPCKARRTAEEYEKLKEMMVAEFDDIMMQLDVPDVKYAPIEDQEIALDLLLDYLDDLLVSPEKYASGGYQGILMDYMNSKFGNGEFEPRAFLKFLLDGNEVLADDLCSLIEDWNEIGAIEKVQRISKLPAKRKQGDKTPASELIAMGMNIFVRYAAKLTATKVTKGDQDYYYEQLVNMLVDAYHNGCNSAVLMQHWPEVYLAWLRSGDEKTLFRTNSYPKISVK